MKCNIPEWDIRTLMRKAITENKLEIYNMDTAAKRANAFGGLLHLLFNPPADMTKVFKEDDEIEALNQLAIEMTFTQLRNMHITRRIKA